jgi:hypothetical protein
MPTSGYTHCACRDCFETVVSDDMDHPDMCDECIEAQCIDGDECNAPHRYCHGDDDTGTYCKDCGEPF